jgi:hypothetical protein
MRREKAAAAVRAGIVEGTGAKSVWGGVQILSAAMAGLANTGKGNASVKAYSELMRMAGFAPSDGNNSGSGDNPGLTITEGALETLRDLVNLYRSGI